MRLGHTVRLLALAIPICLAQAQSVAAGQLKPVNVGGDKPLQLEVPEGYCELDPANPADAGLVNLVTKLLAGHNELLLYAGDCQQLTDWRDGKRPMLDRTVQIQVAANLKAVDFSKQADSASVVPSVCAEIRKKVPADIAGIGEGVQKRLDDLSTSLKINEVSIVGVVGEDAEACYTAMLQKVQLAGQAEQSIAILYATAMIGGRLLFVYHYGDAAELGIFETLQRAAEAHVATMITANR